MPKKVVILELKEDYALAMEEGGSVIRIRRKEHMAVGEQVYVLPEDLYEKKKAGTVLPFAGRTGKGRKALIHLGATAAMVALAVLLLFPQVPMKAHAVVSFDGERGMQMQLGQDNRILSVTSRDGSIPQEELEAFRGKQLTDLGEALQTALGTGPILVAYAPETAQEEADAAAEAAIRSLFGEQGIVFLSGSRRDIAQADAAARSLGRYLLDLKLDEADMDRLEDAYDAYFDRQYPEYQENEALEDRYEAMTTQELLLLLREDASLMQQEAFREELGDQLEDAIESAELPEEEDDTHEIHDHAHDSDDMDDDRDDDMDDDDELEDHDD